jgi:hypothetical protein
MRSGSGCARLWIVAVLASGAGCGAGEVGEACDEPGSEQACVDGAICTNESGDEATCREICESHEDCSEGYSCNGVTGDSTKSCQPDDADESKRNGDGPIVQS